MKRLWRNSQGDTIVEVLIAIAVLSLVLSASYTLATRSSVAVRQSQERGEALRLTASQVEGLKKFIATPSLASTLPASGSIFCVKDDGSLDLFTAPIPPVNTSTENFSSFATHPSCKSGELYYKYIVRQGDTYTAHTRWYNASGNGVDESTMVYRVYPDSVLAGDVGAAAYGTCTPHHEPNNVGGCDPCPAGYDSDGTVACSPIPPVVTVVVKKVTAAVGVQPTCAGTSLGNLGGSTVSLGTSMPTQTTSLGGLNPSGTTFSNLALSTPYTASFTVPSGTNPDGTTPKYSACSPTTASVPAMGPGGIAPTINFKLIPNCYDVVTYSEWRDEGWLVDDPTQPITAVTSSYYSHDNPYGDGRHSEWWSNTYPYSTQPEVFVLGGYEYHHYTSRADGTYAQNSSGPYYNRYNYHEVTSVVGYVQVWHSNPVRDTYHNLNCN